MFENDPKPPRIHRSIQIWIPPIVKPRGKVVPRPPGPNESNRALTRQRAWRERREWRKHAKESADAALRRWSERHAERWDPLKRALVAVTFTVPTKGRRDMDNLLATLKPLLDGMVDAGVVVDDSIATLVEWSIDSFYSKGQSGTTLTFSEPIL